MTRLQFFGCLGGGILCFPAKIKEGMDGGSSYRHMVLSDNAGKAYELKRSALREVPKGRPTDLDEESWRP